MTLFNIFKRKDFLTLSHKDHGEEQIEFKTVVSDVKVSKTCLPQ